MIERRRELRIGQQAAEKASACATLRFIRMARRSGLMLAAMVAISVMSTPSETLTVPAARFRRPGRGS